TSKGSSRVKVVWRARAISVAIENTPIKRTDSSVLAFELQFGRLLRQHHQLLELVKIDRRKDLDIEKKPRSFLGNPSYFADQQAARENPVHARRDDPIARPQVLRPIDVFHGEAVVDHAGHDSARAAALVDRIERGVVIVDQ